MQIPGQMHLRSPNHQREAAVIITGKNPNGLFCNTPSQGRNLAGRRGLTQSKVFLWSRGLEAFAGSQPLSDEGRMGGGAPVKLHAVKLPDSPRWGWNTHFPLRQPVDEHRARPHCPGRLHLLPLCPQPLPHPKPLLRF